jgi:predicted nucleic acid-binding protein
MIFDASVLIAALAGETYAQEALSGCISPKISAVSRGELLALARSKAEWEQLEAFMALLETLDVTAAVADRATVLQRVHGLSWSKAMVLATAHVHELPVMTDGHDLPLNDPAVRRLNASTARRSQRPQLRVA